MITPQKPVGFRQSRRSFSLNRPMSPIDAFIYNFLSMGVIFPWVYLSGNPSAGSSIQLAIWLTLLAQIPISLAYCFLATILPVAGGDYIFQTRAFGKWGFVVVMGGFVIWVLHWVALSGWLFATLGLAPLLLVVGVQTDSAWIANLGLLVQSREVICGISVLLVFGTTWFLTKGLYAYVRIQLLLLLLTVGAIAAMVYVFVSAGDSVAGRLAAFFAHFARLADLTTAQAPAEARADVVQFVIDQVRPQEVHFSLLSTLALVPLAWTSLQWATYSVEQGTEIDEADRFGRQVWMLVAPAFAVTVCLWAVAYVEQRALDEKFLTAAATAWQQFMAGETGAAARIAGRLQPFPNALAMVASEGIVPPIIIALGFLANSFQITCNCFIGMTRILVAMDADHVLPASLRLGEINPVRKSPVRAHWAYAFASLPFIVALNYLPRWKDQSLLGLVVACGAVFAITALAATRIPTTLRSMWMTSNIRGLPPRLISAVGFIGFGLATAMVLGFVAVFWQGPSTALPYVLVIAVFAGAAAFYHRARRRVVNLDRNLRRFPDEIDGLHG